MASENNSSQPEILKALRFPVAVGEILRKRQSLKRELLKQTESRPHADCDSGRLYDDRSQEHAGAVSAGHREFSRFSTNRDTTVISKTWYSRMPSCGTSSRILFSFIPLGITFRDFPNCWNQKSEVEGRVRREMARFESLWEKIHTELGAVIIQNNFDLPSLRPLGNLEASEAFGRVNFVLRLNAEFARYARAHSHFLISDILYLSAQVGQAAWFRQSYWYNFHMALSPMASVALGQSVAAIVKSIYGKSKKCLVLDLDNTLWGGVIGDDGLQNLVLGKDHPVGEAYLDFQRYVKNLRRRGVILAVCSKNDPENAKEGFSHPDGILKLEDFSVFKANWNTKPENIREIAAELNIGLDSMVFVDDNPAERALVEEQLPEVAVPNVGSDVSSFAQVLEHERYFEIDKIVADDLNRSAFYSANAERSAVQSKFASYGDFLASLEMTAEVAPFRPVYLERITQLINKTNQFNLTTRRYTGGEVEAIAQDPAFVTLYGRLTDKFGDNGLVSVVIGKIVDDSLQLDLWLMSCRVLKREMEFAMFDALIEQCQERGIRKILGIYIPSKKNSMVAGHYADLGFKSIGSSDGRERWSYEVPATYSPRTRYIRRTAEALQTAPISDGASVASEV